MATATFNKVNDWLDYEAEAVNLSSDSFMIHLSNTAPTAGTDVTADGNGVIANISPITYTNYSDTLTVDRTLEGVTSTQTGGTHTFDFADFTITASGGAMNAWRYVILYDDTVAGDPVVCFWDYGSSITLNDGDSANINVNASGVYTKA